MHWPVDPYTVLALASAINLPYKSEIPSETMMSPIKHSIFCLITVLLLHCYAEEAEDTVCFYLTKFLGMISTNQKV